MSASHSCGKATGAYQNFCRVCDIREQSICAELSKDEMDVVSKTMAHIPVKEGQALLPRLLGMLVKERQVVKGKIKSLGENETEKKTQLDNK